MAVRVIAIKTLLLVNLYLSGAICAAAEEVNDQRIQQLDQAYQQLVDDIYRSRSTRSRSFDNIEILWSEFQDHLSRQQRVEGHGLILANLNLFAGQADHPAIVLIVERLLKHNERQLAETIYGLVEEVRGARHPYLDYEFAKYYARQRDWLQVSRLLQEVPIDLAREDAEYAYLLQGLSLQFLKQHRQSIESYQAITETSPYYVHARLNTALANIRQGWTIEAQSIISELIPVSRSRNQTELTNRMFVVLGYAMLQQEYFRDARNAFRNVESGSSYAARALFGITLSAVSQGDLVAGLNAVKSLKQRRGHNLSRDEAYLLLPYIHDRLNQPSQIEDSFIDATNHFQSRLLQLQAIANRPVEFDELHLQESGKLTLGEQAFDYLKHYPVYLLINTGNLHQLIEEMSDSDSLTRIQDLKTQYDRLINDIVNALVEEQIEIINSYLNQARYGLARHYDNQSRNPQ